MIALLTTVTSTVPPVPLPVPVDVIATPVNVPSVNVVPVPDVSKVNISPNDFVTPAAVFCRVLSVTFNLPPDCK